MFPHQPLFCVCQTLLAFLKKTKEQTHISKEAEMKLPYLTVIMTHSKEAQLRALHFYTVPLAKGEKSLLKHLAKFLGDISPTYLEQTRK